MEEKILKKIEEQEKKLDKIYDSVEKVRKYFLFMIIMAVTVFILPLIGFVFMIPRMMGLYTDMIGF